MARTPRFARLERRKDSTAALLHRFTLPVARAAAVFVAKQGWFACGYARQADYAGQVLSRTGRWLRDMADLGRGIAQFPELAAALTGDDGAAPIGQVAAHEFARAAQPESLAAWIALARRVTIRRLKDEAQRARAAGSASPLDQAAAPADAAVEAHWDDVPDDERVQVDLSVPGP